MLLLFLDNPKINLTKLKSLIKPLFTSIEPISEGYVFVRYIEVNIYRRKYWEIFQNIEEVPFRVVTSQRFSQDVPLMIKVTPVSYLV